MESESEVELNRAPRRRPRSYPRSYSESDSRAGADDTPDVYATANNEMFPMRVPLERVELGAWRYTAAELDDIELLYELESSHLLVRTSVRGSSDDAPPATFRIRQVSAASLSLVNVVPSSLESMVARLVLETETEISYTCSTVDTVGPENENETPPSHPPSSGEGTSQIESHVVVMTASVHEAGRLRDTLLFLKGGLNPSLASADATFLSPRSRERDGASDEGSPTDSTDDPAFEPPKVQVTFLEGLPYWVGYIPWWLYSKKTRVFIQWLILLYSIITVLWAFWQLYRHVNIIQLALQPIIAALRIHLKYFMETVDVVMAALTVWWMTYLSPLNILLTVFRSQMLQVLLSVRSVFMPLLNALYPMWKLISNSALLSSIKALFWVVYYLAAYVGRLFLGLLSVCSRPLTFLYNFFLQYRVISIDMQRIRLSWIMGLVLNSLRAIGNGFAKLAGYTHKKKKQHKALKHYSTPTVPSSRGATPKRTHQSPRPPIHYSSPLAKQD